MVDSNEQMSRQIMLVPKLYMLTDATRSASQCPNAECHWALSLCPVSCARAINLLAAKQYCQFQGTIPCFPKLHIHETVPEPFEGRPLPRQLKNTGFNPVLFRKLIMDIALCIYNPLTNKNSYLDSHTTNNRLMSLAVMILSNYMGH